MADDFCSSRRFQRCGAYQDMHSILYPRRQSRAWSNVWRKTLVSGRSQSTQLLPAASRRICTPRFLRSIFQVEAMTIEQIDEHISQKSSLGRSGFPDDVAGVVVLLASSESQWLTGQTFHVNGGAHMAS